MATSSPACPGPFYLTPGSTFDRRPHKFGIRILDPDWRIRQHVSFYDPAHEYFATATLTQPQIGHAPAALTRIGMGQGTVNYRATMPGHDDVFVKCPPPGTDLDAERETIALTALARRRRRRARSRGGRAGRAAGPPSGVEY